MNTSCIQIKFEGTFGRHVFLVVCFRVARPHSAAQLLVSSAAKERKRKKTSRPTFELQGKMKLESMVLVNPDPMLAKACLDEMCVYLYYVCLCVLVCVGTKSNKLYSLTMFHHALITHRLKWHSALSRLLKSVRTHTHTQVRVDCGPVSLLTRPKRSITEQ